MIVRIIILYIIGLLIVAAVFGCKDETATEPAPPDTTKPPPVVRKPNIYLYHETHRRISVRLIFPLGGKIVESNPEYGLGWLVNVDPSGRIDGQYDFLFYEAQVPDRYQYNSGWVVRTDTRSGFFVKTMTQAGFNKREIRDFVEYWVPLLNS